MRIDYKFFILPIFFLLSIPSLFAVNNQDTSKYSKCNIELDNIESELLNIEKTFRQDSTINGNHIKARVYSLLNHHQPAFYTLKKLHDNDSLSLEEIKQLVYYLYNYEEYFESWKLLKILERSNYCPNFCRNYSKLICEKVNPPKLIEDNKPLNISFNDNEKLQSELDRYLYGSELSDSVFNGANIYNKQDSIYSKYYAHINDTNNTYYKNNHELILYNQNVWSVNGHHQLKTNVFQLIKILDNKGKEDYTTISIDYNANYDKVGIIRIAIYKPKEIVYNINYNKYSSIYNSSEEDYDSYQQIRINLPKIEVNDVLLINYEIISNNSDFFTQTGFNIDLKDEAVILKQKQIIRIKNIEPPLIKIPKNIVFSNFQENDSTFIWELDKTEQIQREEQADLIEMYPSIEVSFIKKWEELFSWLNVNYNTKYVLTNEMMAMLDKLVSKDSPREVIIENIYNWIHENINYISIEYGKESIIPRSAAVTFENRFGDCKDQSVLLIAFLKYFKIDAYPALLNITSENTIDPAFPSFNFNHCIVYVESDNWSRFIDVARRNTPYNYLFPSDQNRYCFIIKNDKFLIKKTPLSKPEENLEMRFMNIRIDKDNSIVVNKIVNNYGINATMYRNYFDQVEETQVKNEIEYDLNNFCPGAQLTDYEIINKSISLPFTMVENFDVKNWVNNVNNQLYIFKIPTLFFEFNEMKYQERLYPIQYLTTSSKAYEITVKYPDEYRIIYTPEDVKINNPYIDFYYTTKKNINELKIDISYKMKVNYIPLKDYTNLKVIHDSIISKINQQIIFKNILSNINL